MKSVYSDMVAISIATVSLIAVVVKSIINCDMPEFWSYYISMIIVLFGISVYFTIQSGIENKDNIDNFFSRLGRALVDLLIFILSWILDILRSI